MISLIKNEIIKLLRRKKTLIIFIAFTALMATITISGYKEEQNRIKMNTPEAKIESLQYSRSNLLEENEFNGFKFITILFNEVLGNSLLAIGIILFAADMISGECTTSTLKFLLIQPVSRGKILFSKFIAVTLISMGLILPTEFIFFVIVGLLVGFGNFNYPVLTGTRYKFDYTNVGFNGNPPLTEVINSTVVIPIWQHTLYMFLLQALFIICCCAFALLISSIFKSSMASMSLGIISVLIITILSQIVPTIRRISYLLFTSYGAVGSLLQGNLALNFNNPSINVPYGIIVLIAWIILSYLLSHFIFTKRDILV